MSSVTGAVQIGHQSSSGLSAGSSGSPSACAACKYQRRKCTRDCILAPYFPANNQKQFLNAHRLFGVANIMKILNSVDPESRKCAMRSIIDQSNVRAADPVGGCYRIVAQLEKKVKAATAELDFIRRKIDFYRTQMEPPAANIAGSSEANYLAAIEANYLAAIAGGADFYPNMGAIQHHQQQYYNYYIPDAHDGQGSDLNGSMITNGGGVDMDINGPATHNRLDLEMLSLGQVVDAGEDEAAKPLVDIFDMRSTFGIDGGDSREMTAESAVTALPCSAKIEPNDEINEEENVAEQDLKSAASLFTLTNSNTR